MKTIDVRDAHDNMVTIPIRRIVLLRAPSGRVHDNGSCLLDDGTSVLFGSGSEHLRVKAAMEAYREDAG